jgi:hypothetical protein
MSNFSIIQNPTQFEDLSDYRKYLTYTTDYNPRANEKSLAPSFLQLIYNLLAQLAGNFMRLTHGIIKHGQIITNQKLINKIENNFNFLKCHFYSPTFQNNLISMQNLCASMTQKYVKKHSTTLADLRIIQSELNRLDLIKSYINKLKTTHSSKSLTEILLLNIKEKLESLESKDQEEFDVTTKEFYKSVINPVLLIEGLAAELQDKDFTIISDIFKRLDNEENCAINSISEAKAKIVEANLQAWKLDKTVQGDKEVAALRIRNALFQPVHDYRDYILDLSNLNLTNLPACIALLTEQTNLDLSKNNLSSLPEMLGQLTQLEALCLKNNPKLIELPPFLGQMPAMSSIKVDEILDNDADSLLSQAKILRTRLLLKEAYEKLQLGTNDQELLKLKETDYKKFNLEMIPIMSILNKITLHTSQFNKNDFPMIWKVFDIATDHPINQFNPEHVKWAKEWVFDHLTQRFRDEFLDVGRGLPV